LALLALEDEQQHSQNQDERIQILRAQHKPGHNPADPHSVERLARLQANKPPSRFS
jgi:uncharacterized protein HemY